MTARPGSNTVQVRTSKRDHGSPSDLSGLLLRRPGISTSRGRGTRDRPLVMTTRRLRFQGGEATVVSMTTLLKPAADDREGASLDLLRAGPATFTHDPESLRRDLDRLHISFSTSGLGSYRMSARTGLLDPIERGRMFQRVR
jgi:hypothetical protein